MVEAAKERGMPIARTTGCRVGGHVWTWTGPTDAPAEGALCECRMYTWAETRKEEGSGAWR